MAARRVRTIAKLKHKKTGEVFYMPEDQEQPDTAESLEADGLIVRKYESGQWVETLVRDPYNLRVLAWQLTMNAKCHHLGVPEMFKGLPVDVFDEPFGTA